MDYGRPYRTAKALLLCCGLSIATTTFSEAQLGGQPGAYSRMGFGARGMGMGNAMAAVTSGDVEGYYNPALLPWTDYRHVAASMGFLALDRQLNFIGYSQPIAPSAGIAAGIINAGVSDIDGRDSDGEPTGALRTSENQAYLGFAVRFPADFSVGVNMKFLYYHLYTDISSSTVGIDIGVAFRLTQNITLAGTIRDLASKYKWDTAPVYGQQGQSSEDNFPQLYVLAASYRLPDTLGIVAAEIQFSDAGSTVARFGAEFPLVPEFALRGGIDRIDLKDKGNGVKPSLGFTARKSFDSWIPAIVYAYVFEPFSTSGIHMVSLSVAF